MKKVGMTSVIAFAIVLAFAAGIISRHIAPAVSARLIDFQSVVGTISNDGFPKRFIPGSDILIVDLHQWGGNHRGSFGNDFRMDREAASRGWSYVRPYLGANDTPDGCCSAQAMERIRLSIEYAKERSAVDRTYIVGASGGGYSGLCALMSGIKATGYNLWVPISDLTAWYGQSQGRKFREDIMACTGSLNGKLNVEEAQRRSPLYMSMPENVSPVKIYTGIQDGWYGSVPITHSIRMFNKLAQEMGHGSKILSAEETLSLLEQRRAPVPANARLDDSTEVHLHATAGLAEITIFEGGHEGLSSQVVADILANEVN